ncbi:MAG: hypothetical protein AAFN93_13695 [Bacteroidota bacterium]
MIVTDFKIYKKDNNLDNRDNLNELPAEKAVYAIYSRVNGKPENCRFVGATDNLQDAVKSHFSISEKDDCLKEFMQSIKIKTLNYKLMKDASEDELSSLQKEWEDQYQPECTAELNRVY